MITHLSTSSPSQTDREPKQSLARAWNSFLVYIHWFDILTGVLSDLSVSVQGKLGVLYQLPNDWNFCQGIHTFSCLSNISMISGGSSSGISNRKWRTLSAPTSKKKKKSKICYMFHVPNTRNKHLSLDRFWIQIIIHTTFPRSMYQYKIEGLWKECCWKGYVLLYLLHT